LANTATLALGIIVGLLLIPVHCDAKLVKHGIPAVSTNYMYRHLLGLGVVSDCTAVHFLIIHNTKHPVHLTNCN